MRAFKKYKTTYIVLGKLIFTFVAFYIISKRITINPLIYLNKTSIDYFLIAILFSLFLVFLQAWRWKYIIRIYTIQLPYVQCLIAVWFGHLINNFLPASAAGDLLRSYTLRYANNKNKWQWLGAFLSERYSAAVSAISIACLALLISIAKYVPSMLIIFIILLFTSLVLVPVIATKMISTFGLDKINKTINSLYEISKSLSNTFINQDGRKAFAISIFTSLIMCFIFYTIAFGLNIEITFVQCIFIVPAFTILASLPISYAGWG